MTVSLYDISVGSYLQSVGAVIEVLNKGFDYCQANNRDVDEFVNTRMIDDMLPLEFQIRLIKHQSVGCLAGIDSGIFSPPTSAALTSYQSLRDLMASTLAELKLIEPDELNSKSEATILFKWSGGEVPFTVMDFVQSFSLPNLYFHATTAYNLLRKEGVPLGKLDFLGSLRALQQ